MEIDKKIVVKLIQVLEDLKKLKVPRVFKLKQISNNEQRMPVSRAK